MFDGEMTIELGSATPAVRHPSSLYRRCFVSPRYALTDHVADDHQARANCMRACRPHVRAFKLGRLEEDTGKIARSGPFACAADIRIREHPVARMRDMPPSNLICSHTV